MAMTYNELLRRVPVWLYSSNRSLVDEMPVIIEQAEDRLLQVIDHDLFRTVLTGKTVGVDGLLDLSAESPRVLEVRGLRVQYRDRPDGFTPLKARDIEMLSALYPDGGSGDPRYYAQHTSTLNYKLYPKPRAEIDIEVTANVEPARLAVGNQTNILTEQFPRAVERACMHFGAMFMKNYEDAAQYEKDMMAALGEAGAQVGRRRRDEAQTRPRETKNVTGS